MVGTPRCGVQTARRAVLLAIALLFGLQSHGAIFHVTTRLDTTAPNSLRGAIIAANTRGGDNTIILDFSVYRLTIAGGNEDAGYAGDLDITRGSLKILGQLRFGVTINATGLGDRVFHILPGAQLTLENLNITGGTSASAPIYVGSPFGGYINLIGESGGAIYNEGEMILINCHISGNASGNGLNNGGDGGGIYNVGSMMLNNCLVSDNACGSGGSGGSFGGSGGNGGGIRNDGTMVLNNCIISGNTGGLARGHGLFNPNEGGSGGGIYNNGTLLLDNCIVSENTAGNGGGGGAGPAPGKTGGNGGNGGGIYNIGALTTRNCMVNHNACGSGGIGSEVFAFGGVEGIGGNGGNGGSGGGIYNGAAASQAKLIGTSVVANLAGAGGNGGICVVNGIHGPTNIPGGPDGNPGLDGSGPNLFGDFTIVGH